METINFTAVRMDRDPLGMARNTHLSHPEIPGQAPSLNLYQSEPLRPPARGIAIWMAELGASLRCRDRLGGLLKFYHGKAA